jgi:hypothetical protein
MTEGFSGFPQFLQVNAGSLKVSEEPFLPQLFQFITQYYPII